MFGRMRYILSVFVVCCSLCNLLLAQSFYNVNDVANFTKKSLKAMSDMQKEGENLGKSMHKTLGDNSDDGGMQNFLSDPLNSGSYTTLNGKTEFSAGLCPNGVINNFIQISYTAGGSGSRYMKVQEDLNGDGKYDYTYNSKAISGVCERGYISCSGRKVVPYKNGCSVYRFLTDKSGRIKDEAVSENATDINSPTDSAKQNSTNPQDNPTDYMNVVGYCQCATKWCDRNAFDEDLLDILNSAVILAIQNGNHNIYLTHYKSTQNTHTFVASATDMAKCSIIKGSDVYYDNNGNAQATIDTLSNTFSYKQPRDLGYKLQSAGSQAYYRDLALGQNAAGDTLETFNQVMSFKKKSGGLLGGDQDIVTGMSYGYDVYDPITRSYRMVNNNSVDVDSLFNKTLPNVKYQSGLTGDTTVTYVDQNNRIQSINQLPSTDDSQCLIKTCIVMLQSDPNEKDTGIGWNGVNKTQTRKVIPSKKGGKYSKVVRGKSGADMTSYEARTCNGDTIPVCPVNVNEKKVLECGCHEDYELSNPFAGQDPRSMQAFAILASISEGAKSATCGKKLKDEYAQDVPQTHTEDIHYGTTQDLVTIMGEQQLGSYEIRRYGLSDVDVNQENTNMIDIINQEKGTAKQKVREGLRNKASRNQNVKLPFSETNKQTRGIKSKTVMADPVTDTVTYLTGSIRLDSLSQENQLSIKILLEGTASALSVIISSGQKVDINSNNLPQLVQNVADVLKNNSDISNILKEDNVNITNTSINVASRIAVVGYNYLTQREDIDKDDVIKPLQDVLNGYAKNIPIGAENSENIVPIAGELAAAKFSPEVAKVVNPEQVEDDLHALLEFGDIGSDESEGDTDSDQNVSGVVDNQISECTMKNLRIFQGKYWSCKDWVKPFHMGTNCCKEKKLADNAADAGIKSISTSMAVSQTVNLATKWMGVQPVTTDVLISGVPSALSGTLSFISGGTLTNVASLNAEAGAAGAGQVVAQFNPYAIGASIAVSGVIQALGLFKTCSKDEFLLQNYKSWYEDRGKTKSNGKCAYYGKKEHKRRIGFFKIHDYTRYKYCCFDSVLARIIWDQGTVQLNKKRDKNCEGFTPDEFQRINFNDIDFTEWTDYILKDMKGDNGKPSDDDEQASFNENILQPQIKVIKDNQDLLYEKVDNITKSIENGIGGLY